MPKCPNCERETMRTTDWACQWCGYPLSSGSFKMIPKTFQQLKEEAWQKTKPEREPDSGAGPEGGLETAMEAELVVEPVAESAKDREPTPEPASEPTLEPEAKPSPPPVIEPEPAPESQSEPLVAPKPAGGPEPIPEARVIPLGEPHREQLPKPEKAAEPQPGSEPGSEPIKRPEPEPTPQPEPGPEPIPQPEPAPAPKPIKKPEPVAEELTVDELIEAYEQDAPAADARFLDKRLMVTGVVALIDVKETLDTHYVRLAGAEGDISRSVKCLFDKKHAPDLSQLEKGQTATVQGKFNGSLIAIRMIDCELG